MPKKTSKRKSYEASDEWEFGKVTDKLAELVKFGGELAPACARCPYADRCKKEELWWGCCAWEQSMGEDL